MSLSEITTFLHQKIVKKQKSSNSPKCQSKIINQTFTVKNIYFLYFCKFQEPFIENIFNLPFNPIPKQDFYPFDTSPKAP